MDSVPTNIEPIGAPFSLEAARERHTQRQLEPPVRVPNRKPRGPHPRLQLVASSSVPDATSAQITDARERFLGRITQEPAPRLGIPVLVSAGPTQPSLALLRRMPRLPAPDDGDRPGA